MLICRFHLFADVDRGSILSLIRSNFERNLNKFPPSTKYQVEEIDFYQHDWQDNLCQELKQVDLILAADVVYDCQITEAFFDTLESCLKQKDQRKTLVVLIALEKRFWMDDQGQISAPSYDFFLKKLEEFSRSNMKITVEQQPIDFPHILSHSYQREEGLVLWKLTC